MSASRILENRRRRRRPWLVLAVFLVQFGGQLVWKFRPLSTAERKLVGRWEASDGRTFYRFEADRRFAALSRDPQLSPIPGTWSATDASISIQHDDSASLPGRPLLERLVVRVYLLFLPVTAEVRWYDPNHFELREYDFRRLSGETAGPYPNRLSWCLVVWGY